MTSVDPYRPPVPAADAALAEEFAVTFKPPGAGWIDIEIACNCKKDIFSSSYVFFGYKRVKTWLEEVAGGNTPYVEIDEEGWWTIFLVNDAPGQDMVRFTVWHESGGPIPERPDFIERVVPFRLGEPDESTLTLVRYGGCDVLIPRKHLVRVFYAALLAFWEKPDSASFWREWDNTTPEDWVENHYEPYGTWHFHMESDVIDAYLADGEG